MSFSQRCNCFLQEELYLIAEWNPLYSKCDYQNLCFQFQKLNVIRIRSECFSYSFKLLFILVYLPFHFCYVCCFVSHITAGEKQVPTTLHPAAGTPPQ